MKRRSIPVGDLWRCSLPYIIGRPAFSVKRNEALNTVSTWDGFISQFKAYRGVSEAPKHPDIVHVIRYHYLSFLTQP